MKTLVIKEFNGYPIPDSACFDLSEAEMKNCAGCWTCWWKTPGICIYKDLEDFYRSYVNADRAVIFAKPENGFISSRMKTLLDRMIPLYLPYTMSAKGGTWHLPRYPKYPDIMFYYDYDFHSEDERQVFHDYIRKVFEQFHSKQICIRPITDFQEVSI